MSKKYVGVDLGTSGVKVGVIDKEGKIIFTTTETYPLISKGLNSEQVPADWWTGVVKAFSKIPSNIKAEIESISFAGQMHGMVALDGNGEVLHNAILWNDTRTFKEVKYLNEEIGVKKISKITGNKALEGFTAPKILWLKRNKADIFNKTKMFLLPKDWLAYKFTGKYATEPSDASGTLYYDIHKNSWSDEMLDILGINSSQLPKILKSNEVVGSIKEDIALELSLNKDVKIVIGGGDNAVNALAQGVLNDGNASISLGTSGVIYVATDKCIVTPANELHSFCSVTGEYAQLGVTLAAAGSMEWFARKVLNNLDFTEIMSKSSFENKNTILYLPYISGERTPINDPLSSGTLIGLKREHDYHDIAQAVVEGVSFSLKQTFEITKNNNININRVFITGGGSKNPFWTKLIASLLNIEIEIMEEEFGPFYGAALLALQGAGHAIPKSNIKTKKIKPNTSVQEFYDKKYELWLDLYEQTKSISHKLNNIKES